MLHMSTQFNVKSLSGLAILCTFMYGWYLNRFRSNFKFSSLLLLLVEVDEGSESLRPVCGSFPPVLLADVHVHQEALQDGVGRNRENTEEDRGHEEGKDEDKDQGCGRGVEGLCSRHRV